MPAESLKESLEAAFDEDPNVTDSVDTPPVDETPPVVDESVVDEPKSTEAAPTEGEPAPDGDERTAVEAAGKEEGEGKEGEEVPVAVGLKPPSSWKPSMRDKFLTLPEDVQREVLRREVDISKGMEIAAESRKFKQEFDTHVAPYAAEIASRGVSAMDAFDNYLQTAYALRHAPMQEKASLVAGLINQYGVDVGTL